MPPLLHLDGSGWTQPANGHHYLQRSDRSRHHYPFLLIREVLADRPLVCPTHSFKGDTFVGCVLSAGRCNVLTVDEFGAVSDLFRTW